MSESLPNKGSEHGKEEQFFHGEIYLVTQQEFDALPDGSELISINGERAVKGIDAIDTETRHIYTAWGLPIDGTAGKVELASRERRVISDQHSTL